MYLKLGQSCAIKAGRFPSADLRENLLVPGAHPKAAASDAELTLSGYSNQLNK